MRCLVTGAAGFVGSTLSDRLLADGHEVVGVDCFVDYYPRELKQRNLRAALEHPSFSFQEGNLLELELDPLLEGVDWIFHQAAQAGVRASWGEYFQSYTDNNVLATQRLLERARSLGSLKRVVFASSSSVYGNAESMPTSEDLNPAPVSPYGVTKLASEHLMSLYASEFGVPTVSLRYFTVYGPRQRPDMAFHRFIRAALLGEKITLYGDGEQSRDFTFIDDIVEANVLSAERGQAGDVFNVGGGTIKTINDILDLLRSQIGELKIDRLERQAGDARHTSADTSRVQERLGFVPKVPIEEGISREIQWMKELIDEDSSSSN